MALLAFVQHPVGPWTDGAIRDTVAAIANQPAYDREFTQSLWDRIVRWLSDRLLELFSAIGHLQYGRAITYALLALVVVLIAARLVIGMHGERVVRTDARRSAPGVGAAAMMADAERLAEAGDYTRAAHLLYSALLMAGASRGELRLHPSKTTGDYALDLRRSSASWLKLFQSFRGRYDRVIYGDMSCSADDYQELAQVARAVFAPARAA